MNAFISLPDLLAQITVSKSAVYAWIKAGLFPAPVKLGPRRVAWRQSDVDAWINSRSGVAA